MINVSCVLAKKSLPILRFQRYSTFSSTNVVLTLHCSLSFNSNRFLVWCEVRIEILHLPHTPAPSNWSSNIFWEDFSIPSSNYFGTFVGNHLTICVSLFLNSSFCVLIYLSVFTNTTLSRLHSSEVVLFFQDYLVILSPFPCNIDFRISICTFW